MALNADRLASVAHYVVARCPPDRLGATKLNKVLWFGDIIFYRRHGRTITGAETYVKRQYGPVPGTILAALDQLAREGKILVRWAETPAGPRKEFIWLKEPDVDTFKPEEIDVLHEVMAWICDGESAKSISDLTHDALWEETEIGAPMLVRAGAVVPAEITPESIEWAKGAFPQ